MPATPSTSQARALSVRAALVAGLMVTAVVAAVSASLATAAEPIEGLPRPPDWVRLGLPAIRVLLDIAAVATVGLSLLPKLLGYDEPEQTEPLMRPARRAAVQTASAWVFFALVAIVFYAADAVPDRPLTPAAVVGYVVQITAPKGLLFSAVLALLYVGIARLAVRFGERVPAELRIVVALLALLPLPVTGHAANWKWHDFTMISVELHVVAAALWTGGLAAMAVLAASRRDLLATTLPRFSRLATIALALVGVTGIFDGLVQLGLETTLPGSVFSTDYGRLLLAKAACLTAVAALGAHIRWRLLPRIATGRPTAVFGWALLEVGAMGVAYGLAVALIRTPIGG